MANKVYDYSLYTGKDLSLTYENFDTPEALRDALEISATITFEGTKTFIGSGGEVSGGFRIIINNLDSQYGLLKATTTTSTNIHPEAQSGNQVILTFPNCIVSEISLGEQTAYKVYNSYRGYNQQLEQNESYGPGGCVLDSMFNKATISTQVVKNIGSQDLKCYTIPAFAVDNRFIQGAGWHRSATTEEVLKNMQGYQTRYPISPFNTNKPCKMLFLDRQLKDPAFTILYNGGDGTENSYTSPIITINGNTIQINQESYQLQSNDVLVRYRVSNAMLQDGQQDATYGPFSGTSQGTRPERFLSQSGSGGGDSASSYGIIIRPPRFSNEYQNYVTGLVKGDFTCEIKISIYSDNQGIDSTDALGKSVYQTENICLQKDLIIGDSCAFDYGYYGSFVSGYKYAPGRGDTVFSPEGYTVTIPYEINIHNVPYINIKERLGDTITPTSNTKGPTIGWTDFFGTKFTQPNQPTVYISGAYLSGDGGKTTSKFFACNSLIPIENYNATGTDQTIFGTSAYNVITHINCGLFYDGVLSETQAHDFDLYAVWHFVAPPDEITEGTGNGGSVGNATPF